MERYLLDTSPLAAFLLGRRRALETISPWIAQREALTSIIVYGEVEDSAGSHGDQVRPHARDA